MIGYFMTVRQVSDKVTREGIAIHGKETHDNKITDDL